MGEDPLKRRRPVESDPEIARIIALIKDSFTLYAVDRKLFETDYELGYDDDAGIVQRLVAGKRWDEIDWQYITDQAYDAWLTPSYICLDAYRQLFPSFLLDCVLDELSCHVGGSLLAGLFVESHLTIGNLWREDLKAFLLDLPEVQKRCVATVLAFLMRRNPQSDYLQEAFRSYWKDYLPVTGKSCT